MSRLTAIIALTLMALASTIAQAQEDPFGPAPKAYIGAGLGLGGYRWANNPAGGNAFCNDRTATNIHQCEDQPLGYKFFLGYQLTDYLGLEMSLYNAGKAELTFTNIASSTLKQRVYLRGAAFSLTGTLPLGSAAYVSARAGIAAGAVLREDHLDGVRIYDNENVTAQPAFGLSLGINASRRLTVRLDWDRVSGETVFHEEFEADLATLNLLYRF